MSSSAYATSQRNPHTLTHTNTCRLHQSHLQCIQAVHFSFISIPWELNPQPFALLTQCEPQESLSQTISKVKNRFHTGKASKFTLDIYGREKGSKISLLFLFIIGVMTTGCSDSVPQFMCLRTTQQRDIRSLSSFLD